ncbi:MAG: hypothetical protein RL348_102 [Bacteroidota bacterium]|jgi:hypothetical protein
MTLVNFICLLFIFANIFIMTPGVLYEQKNI